MPTPAIAIRIGTTGAADVRNDFKTIGDAGDEAAARLSKSMDRAAADADAAQRRYAAAQAKLAAITTPTSTGGIIDQNTGVGQNAGASGATFAALSAQMAGAEAQATALRAAIDPLFAAQQRYDAELGTANRLLALGSITEQEHAAAVAMSEAALSRARGALDQHSNSLGFNRTQFMIAEGAAHRYVDSILAGMSPMRAFMMQAGDIGNVLAMDDGGVAGGLSKVRALLSPTVVGVTATAAAVAIGATAWLSYNAAIEKLQAISRGGGAVIGVSGNDLEANAEAAARASNISISAARDIEAKYVEMGGVGKDVLVGLTSITKDFATATGQDSKTAVQQLGQAFQDPIKGAEELTARYGTFTGAQLEHIHQLVEQNDLYGAQQVLLEGLGKQFDGAAQHAGVLAKAWEGISTAASNAFTTMGNALNRLFTGGGALNQQLAGLERARTILAANPGYNLSGVDKQISTLKSEIAEANDVATGTTRARQQAGQALAVAGKVTGTDDLSNLKDKLGVLNSVLGDTSNKAGLTRAQLANLRVAQDEYTHAVTTYIPEGQRAVEIAKLDAQAAATKNPAIKARIEAQKSELEQSGKLITSSQASALADANATKAKNQAAMAGSGHAATLAREAQSMEVATRASIALAEAYLQGGSAAVEAEARRKAMTDATKKGIDVEDQVRRQLALNVADGIANGAKSVAQLRDETTARQAVNDNVSAGTLAVGQMSQAMSDEAAIRPLLKLQMVAQGDALTELTKLIEAYRKALADAHAEEAHGNALKAIAGFDQAIAQSKLSASEAGDFSGKRQRDLARQQAGYDADQAGVPAKDRDAFINTSVGRVVAQQGDERAQSAADQLKDLQDSTELAREQATWVGKSADEQARLTSRTQLEQQLAKSLGDQYDQFAPAILAAKDAMDQQAAATKQAAASAEEFKNFAGAELDKVFDPQNWKNFGDLGKSILKDLEAEFIKLALLNPLKNALFGGSGGGGGLLPTLGTVLHFDSGTDYASGGASWVGENGPELVNLPRGSRVQNAADSRRTLASSDNRRAVHNHYDLRGAIVYEDLLKKIETRAQMAEARGAQGGAQLAKAQGARSKHFSLGRGG